MKAATKREQTSWQGQFISLSQYLIRYSGRISHVSSSSHQQTRCETQRRKKKKEKKKKKKRNMTRRVEEAEKKVTKLISKQRMNKQWYEVSQYTCIETLTEIFLDSFGSRLIV